MGKQRRSGQNPPRKRGGQPGNSNAAGHGAPFKNKNAETHGAYSTVNMGDISPAERKRILGMGADVRAHLLDVLRRLWAKEAGLHARIARLEAGGASALYTEREIEMLVPSGGSGADSDMPGGKAESMTTAMKTIIRAAPFDMIIKLSAELDKTQGRIVKTLDTLRAFENDNKRLDLDRRKYTLAKQKAFGEYNVNLETNELNDDYETDENDNLSDD
ncbi:MAG: hypothetical protein FWC70_05620 [Defluviitaleaceae bacterium]|nr:hypothetical protein [Defluviitaleaceae bacterium]